MCLRLTILGVPPVVPLIHQSFELSQAAIGALTSLPVLVFAFVSVPGAILISRFGAAHALVGALLIAGVGSALRGASFDVPTLFLATALMGAGIGFMHPALPAIVGEWLPRKVALGTAVYSNGLLVGEALSASLTIPVLLPLVGDSWRWNLVAWSLPLLVVAAAAAWCTRQASGTQAPQIRPVLWWPDWRSFTTWRLGLISGGVSGIYFSSNAFLPDYLHHTGRPDLTGAALSALNWGQIPASVLLLVLSRLMLRRSPLMAMAGVSLIAILGLISTSPDWSAYWSAVIGFSAAFNLIVTLGLPPLLAGTSQVHSLSAGMFTISYLCAVLVPVVGGVLWDSSGVPGTAFLPAAACAVIIMALAAGLPMQARAQESG